MDAAITPPSLTSSEDRALTLLGQGLSPEVVASAIGLSPSRISQMISDPVFAARIAELRFNSLVKHSARDEIYDTLEETLQARLKDCLPFMMKPLEILRAIQVINGAKRRGISSPNQIHGQQTVVSLIIPTKVVKNLTININNQVVKAGEQELITVQSNQLEKLAENHVPSRHHRAQNVEDATISPSSAGS